MLRARVTLSKELLVCAFVCIRARVCLFVCTRVKGGLFCVGTGSSDGCRFGLLASLAICIDVLLGVV